MPIPLPSQPLEIIAGLLVVALILWLIVPSGVFTFNINTTLGATGGIGVGDVAVKADELIATHFRANYGGDLAKLPEVIGGLLEPLRALFASSGVQLDREKLRTVILVSTAKHNLAPPGEVNTAFDRVP